MTNMNIYNVNTGNLELGIFCELTGNFAELKQTDRGLSFDPD